MPIFSIFCWIVGALYALLTLGIGFWWLFLVLWFGPDVVREKEVAFIVACIGSLTLMTWALSIACFASPNADRHWRKWITAMVVALVSSIAGALSMAAFVWSHKLSPSGVEAGISALILSVWAVQAVLGLRTHAIFVRSDRHHEDEDP
jgi:hypothetical protein